jgi:glycosyltransferase involved in cell wall biosynthesis
MFADMYLPHVSGVTNHISLYKRHFEDLGHEVYVFTFGDVNHADQEPRIIRTPGIPWGKTGWRLASGLSREARELVPTLDVAHVHHPFQSGRLVRPIAKAAGVPMVFTNHTRYDLYSDAYATFVPRAMRYAYLRSQLNAFARACALVIAPAESIARWLEEFAGYDKATVIPNGIDVDRFAHPSHAISRADLGFADSDVVYCYSGRLGPEKNTEWLASEFALVAREIPEARLLVVGDGPSREAAEAILSDAGVADRARFVGMVPYERVPGFEAAADVFVTGSVSEVHPLVVLEAMAAGLPVVAVESPGISDTVEHGATGLLAPRVERRALADSMIALARDRESLARMRARAREAAGRYDWDHTANVVFGHYERLSRDRSRR